MKTKTQRGKPSRKGTRISLGSRLNLQFWSRLIGIFLIINVFLLTTAAITMVIYGERRITKVVTALSVDEPADTTSNLLAAAGVHATKLHGQPEGTAVPPILGFLVPPETIAGTRSLTLSEPEGSSGWSRLNSLRYTLDQPIDGSTYRIGIELEPIIRVVKTFFLVLWSLQVYYAIQSAFTGARAIRRTLQPIVTLAEKAQTLQTNQGPYSPDEMKLLAGKLASINANRLDTRIEINGSEDALKDVTAAINSMLTRIDASYRAQARFVSDASHELRTPIAAIQGYANLLDRWGKNDQDALQESIDAIKAEAAGMKELIEQLLFLARGDNHALPLDIQYLDMATLGSTLLKETQMWDTAHHWESTLSPALIAADATLIKQAIRILVDNAQKYTPPDGTIRLSSSEQMDTAIFTVQDEGIGIPEEAIPRVFDRFFRADESRARSTGGTGLGLAIAKWIAERHGGYLEVLSRQDLGTRISIVLPARDTTEQK